MRTSLRWAGRIGAGLLAVVLVATGAVYALSARRLARRFPVPHEAPLALSTDDAVIARGHRLATTHGCTECHGANLAGQVIADNAAIGRLSAANLTRGRGGRGGALDARALDLAIRHGVRPDGSPLVVMPSNDFQSLTDEDFVALASYVRSVPPVDRDAPATALGPVGRAILVSNQAAMIPAERIPAHPHVQRLMAAPTPAYGRYLATTCQGCHGEHLSGGAQPGRDGPPPQNLTPDPKTGIGAWSEGDFVRALRTGVRPDGSTISDAMPWRAFRDMDDVELRALYAYLRTLSPRPAGGH